MLKQPDNLGLSPRRTRNLSPPFLKNAIAPWPSALYGLPARRRCPAPGEEEVRTRICRLLKERRLTRTALAQAIGVSVSSVSGALSGKDSVPMAWLPHVAAALSTTEGELLAGIEWRPRRGRPRRTGSPPPRLKRKERPGDAALRARLRQLMQSRQLRQRDVASAIGVTPCSVSDILTGRMALPPAWLVPLASLFKLTISQMLRGLQWSPRKQR